MKCFYHSADLDGQCSGAIIKYTQPDCEMIAIDYGQPFPWELITDPNEVIWMIDFCLQPFSDMVKLDGLCRLYWIDHHKSAIEEYHRFARENGVFKPDRAHVELRTDYAACELTWMTQVPSRKMPEAVHLLGRYDIWKDQETPGALQFQYGMRLQPDTRPESYIWRELFASGTLPEDLRTYNKVLEIKRKGATCLSYERQQNEKFIQAYGFDVEFEGLKCVAANRGMSNSLLFESVWNHEKYDAMLMFAWKDGQYTVSLYSDKPGIDVSVVAKKYGGGGHVGSSGFQCATLPFLEVKHATVP